MYNARMTQKVDIKALATLARLEVSEAEMAKLEKELPGILAFVEQVQKASTDMVPPAPTQRNVMREDTNPHESGIYTETLLSAAPAREKNRIAVKQVLKKK